MVVSIVAIASIVLILSVLCHFFFLVASFCTLFQDEHVFILYRSHCTIVGRKNVLNRFCTLCTFLATEFMTILLLLLCIMQLALSADIGGDWPIKMSVL